MAPLSRAGSLAPSHACWSPVSEKSFLIYAGDSATRRHIRPRRRGLVASGDAILPSYCSTKRRRRTPVDIYLDRFTGARHSLGFLHNSHTAVLGLSFTQG